MMEYTDRHFRYMLSLISHTLVPWTEMINAGAIINNPEPHLQRRFLYNGPTPLPTVLQLGGSDPDKLEEAAYMATVQQPTMGVLSEINLNCGCPSDKVAGKGQFGARLMQDPSTVEECVVAMKRGVDLAVSSAGVGRPTVSVKCRIGTDEDDSYDDFASFVEGVPSCGTFHVHARSAILDKNFSPADNRNIPPLHPEYVYRLKSDRPDLHVTLNGGLTTLPAALLPRDACESLDGVMVGRGIVANPWEWSYLDAVLGRPPADAGLPKNRRELVAAYASYAAGVEEEEGARHRRRLCRPLVNIFNGERGSKLWRRAVDEVMSSAGSKRRGYGAEDDLETMLLRALDGVEPEAADRSRLGTFEMVLEGEEREKREAEGGGRRGRKAEQTDRGGENPVMIWNGERKERERVGRMAQAMEAEEIAST